VDLLAGSRFSFWTKVNRGWVNLLKKKGKKVVTTMTTKLPGGGTKTGAWMFVARGRGATAAVGKQPERCPNDSVWGTRATGSQVEKGDGARGTRL